MTVSVSFYSIYCTVQTSFTWDLWVKFDLHCESLKIHDFIIRVQQVSPTGNYVDKKRKIRKNFGTQLFPLSNLFLTLLGRYNISYIL